ncbi:MAG: PhoH family protein [Thermotogaceae bacterium]|nr:PhoH family protein [Thermotogaceae bacterium]
MVKNYVLDTNVLIHDPKAIYSFEDNVVVIPLPVIEELDRLKKEAGSVGRNAREVIRELDSLREKGNLSKGIKLESGGMLKILVLSEDELSEVPEFLYEKYMDNWILVYTLTLMRLSQVPTYLVTKDINLRVKADSLGIPAQNYLTDRSDLSALSPGYRELKVDEKLLSEFRHKGFLTPEELGIENSYENEYFDISGTYGIYRNGKVELIRIGREVIASEDTFYLFKVGGIYPRNREQFFALHALCDDEINLVSLIGIAGTGKTLLSLACAIEKRKRIIVTRPTIPVGRDIGYLPGKVEEKMRPWMQPIYDNLELIMERLGMNLENFIKRGRIEIEVLSYIRGRSIPDQYMIIDEAQNLTPHEVKTILTRVGEGTKVVLVGDPYQIDTPYLDVNSNGLVYTATKFLRDELASHIILTKGERSKLATKAAELL